MPVGENSFEKRKRRVRYSIKKRSNGKLRLSVHRTGKHLYAQIIDDSNAVTLISASTLDKDFGSAKTSNVAAAFRVGQILAAKATSADIKTVVFDRGGFLFHGRIKAVADGAREAGLSI
jgi:large subunit ribosomal protein L18